MTGDNPAQLRFNSDTCIGGGTLLFQFRLLRAIIHQGRRTWKWLKWNSFETGLACRLVSWHTVATQ
jgi:hypothetical protein